jgi:hypothetical protein
MKKTSYQHYRPKVAKENTKLLKDYSMYEVREFCKKVISTCKALTNSVTHHYGYRYGGKR